MTDPDHTGPDQPAEDKAQRREFSKRYDLVDDARPDPVNVAPSEQAPAVDPFTGTDED